MAAVRIPYLLGHAEIAALYGVKRQTSQVWRTDGTLPEADLVASGNPYWLLLTVLQLAGAGGREVTPQRLAEYKAGIRGGYDLERTERLPPIVGIKEVARLLGKDQQAISRWRNRRQIANADVILSRSPLWLLETVLADAAVRGRVVLPHEVELLRAGDHAPQKPRGRRPTPASAGHLKPGLPAARAFTNAESHAAAEFLAAVLAAGHAVVIRPKRGER
ncbi:hypothetical protein [Streptomyces sp. NPDC056244]|uniref:hypothetical protein n=1 Tax=Streptomyces sp. NPDC056244 TaxID=3345762 RepID=UPI0035D7318A